MAPVRKRSVLIFGITFLFLFAQLGAGLVFNDSAFTSMAFAQQRGNDKKEEKEDKEQEQQEQQEEGRGGRGGTFHTHLALFTGVGVDVRLADVHQEDVVRTG